MFKKRNKNLNNLEEFDEYLDNKMENEEDDFMQISFDTEPQPESETESEILESNNNKTDNSNDGENINDEHIGDNSNFVSNEDLEIVIESLIDSNNKKTTKSIVISTVLSSLITASAIGGYYFITKDSIKNSPSEIVISSSGKDTNVYKAVATKCTPSVVGITTLTIDTNNFFNLPMQSEGVGSGVIVDKNGYILTNSHVVDDGNATKVSVMFNDGTSSDGKVLWNDATLDLAIVKVDKKNLDVAELGNSDELEVGDIAIAIGNPIGLELNRSVTQGIISGKDRSLATNKGSMTGLLQTDASINPGNSGGPLLNDEGKVIGINTAKLSETEGLGFAIPINIAKPIVEQIITKGDFEKVSLGIKGVDVTNVKTLLGVELSVDNGVYIIEVSSNTPASSSGIQTGDIITKIDEQEVTSMSDLNKALYKYSKGDSAKISIVREGKESSLTVNFSKKVSTINNIETTENNTTTKENNLDIDMIAPNNKEEEEQEELQ